MAGVGARADLTLTTILTAGAWSARAVGPVSTQTRSALWRHRVAADLYVAMVAIRGVLQNEHEDPDQVALASDTDDGGGDSSDEPFDYDYSDGGPVSGPEKEGLEEALVHTAVPAVRRPYTDVICGSARDSARLGRYDHTFRSYAGPGMLAVQIEERRAELAFLRAVWPQGPT